MSIPVAIVEQASETCYAWGPVTPTRPPVITWPTEAQSRAIRIPRHPSLPADVSDRLHWGAWTVHRWGADLPADLPTWLLACVADLLCWRERQARAARADAADRAADYLDESRWLASGRVVGEWS